MPALRRLALRTVVLQRTDKLLRKARTELSRLHNCFPRSKSSTFLAERLPFDWSTVPCRLTDMVRDSRFFVF
jgi:hypothetical protein